jgi:hypothetical protein
MLRPRSRRDRTTVDLTVSSPLINQVTMDPKAEADVNGFS